MNGFFVLCLVLCIGFGVAILWSRNENRAALHTLHKQGSGCRDCEDLS